MAGGERELVAIIDRPAAAGGTVKAAWRQILSTSVDLEPVTGGLTKKYGAPGFGGPSDSLLLWGDVGNRRCEEALNRALEYRAPLD